MPKSHLGPLMLDVAGFELDGEDRDLLRHPSVGGVILFARNYAEPGQLRALCRQLQRLRDPRLLIAVDHEGGRVQRFRDGFTRLPSGAQIGAAFDADPAAGLQAAGALGKVIAIEVGSHGMDLAFAPVLDLNHGVSEVIGSRAFHAQADAAIALGKAFLSGMRKQGMAATGKHFPGHGGVTVDSHEALPVECRDLDALAADRRVFAELIQAGLPTIMPAHVRYPAVDERPACFSPVWLQKILRGELGFEGVIFSDDLSMGGAAIMGGYGDRVLVAKAAGCDMLLVCNNRAGAVEAVDRMGGAVDAKLSRRLQALYLKPSPASRAQDVPGWAEAVACLLDLPDA